MHNLEKFRGAPTACLFRIIAEPATCTRASRDSHCKLTPYASAAHRCCTLHIERQVNIFLDIDSFPFLLRLGIFDMEIINKLKFSQTSHMPGLGL